MVHALRSTAEGLVKKPVGEPDAGDRHIWLDERGWETERWPQAIVVLAGSEVRARPVAWKPRPGNPGLALGDAVQQIADFFRR
jgi:hypothetical protein